MVNAKESEVRLKNVGDKLKALRLQAGYKSAETFAFDNEINRVQYWRMEKGANFTMHSLMKVLDIHKLSLSNFFEDLE